MIILSDNKQECQVIKDKRNVIYQNQQDVAQSGRVPGLEPGCQRFKSFHPDQGIGGRERLAGLRVLYPTPAYT